MSGYAGSQLTGGVVGSAGLEMNALYGWFDKCPFAEASREFVRVARKPS